MQLEQYGATRLRELGRVEKFAAKTLARSWAGIPHVTHFDELPAERMLVRRDEINRARPLPEARLSPLPFVMKAVARALKDHPALNAALSPDGGALILRDYVDIGLAIDTPRGLLVGVVRDCLSRSIEHIASDAAALSAKARDKGLALGDMSGAGFTISSLGTLGGTAFTPIIPPDQVAILGISRLYERPVRGDDGSIAWRNMLPVSLSYDHRAISGADAGRFIASVREHLDSGDD